MENNQDKPLVSILIPSYNHAKYICNCLDSIAKDNYPNKEIIVIDDGSKDESVFVIQEWYEANKATMKYPFKLISRENRGLSKTLNELISHSQGKYIYSIASDDFLLMGGIEARVKYLEENTEKQAVFGDAVIVDCQNEMVVNSLLNQNGRKRFLNDDTMIASELIFHWCVSGPLLIIKKMAFDFMGGYDERLSIEDWDFYLKLCAKDWLGFIDIPVAAYRIHDKNTSKNPTVWGGSKESLYLSFSNNYQSFTGLNKWNLYARMLIVEAKISKEKNVFTKFFTLQIGRTLSKITKWLYKMKTGF